MVSTTVSEQRDIPKEGDTKVYGKTGRDLIVKVFRFMMGNLGTRSGRDHLKMINRRGLGLLIRLMGVRRIWNLGMGYQFMRNRWAVMVNAMSGIERIEIIYSVLVIMRYKLD